MEVIQKIPGNHTVIPSNSEELMKLRNGKWKVYEVEKTEPLFINNKRFNVRAGLTFTPFANPTKCNAHCRFCSEELQRKHQKELTALNVINDYDKYFEALAKVLEDLSQIENIGLSLSGLEATSDPVWLLRFLDAISIGKQVPDFDEKVLYTNSTGLYKYPDLIYALKEARFDRLEISRCHYDDKTNQKIMYINRNEPVYQNEAYEKMIGEVQRHVHIKNSCILTQIGVNSVAEVERYLDWIMSLGVKEVVFRELSRLDDNYIENKTKIWAEKNRVPVDSLLEEIMQGLGSQKKDWVYQHSKVGYYYYNEQYRYKNEVDVIFETSSYNELMSRNKTNAIQKLVFHSNGNLCGDWDPNSYVLNNYYS